jgi:hypothetical protein
MARRAATWLLRLVVTASLAITLVFAASLIMTAGGGEGAPVDVGRLLAGWALLGACAALILLRRRRRGDDSGPPDDDGPPEPEPVGPPPSGERERVPTGV